jgi:DNA-binding transcriptional MocR family regulator
VWLNGFVIPNTEIETARAGVIELRFGHPDPALLPVEAIAVATEQALREHGRQALAYGLGQGPRHLLEPLSARLARIEGRPVPVERLMLTGGISPGLDLACTILSRPGEVVLVEAPVYHLALQIFRDHGLRVIGVESDAHGLVPEALTEAARRAEQAGTPVRFVYTVPSFSNPTGFTLSAERRPALVELAARRGAYLLEDDVYRELYFTAPPPPPLAAWDEGQTVIRFGSVSKILAPGLRLGWIEAAPALITRLSESGVLDSGGSPNQWTAYVLAALIGHDQLDSHVARLRAVYAERKQALVEGLRAHASAQATWTDPAGGFFVWFSRSDGADLGACLPAALARGVSYVPGGRFGGSAHSARLCFAMYPPDQLREAAWRLAQVEPG